jgi:RNA polymerase sigma-70 factor, ECF subfamily
MATSGELIETDGPVARADAFRRLADRHLDASYRLARAILQDASEAEDATHDAFVTAWRKWSTLRDPARFEHWFHRILVNTCRNRLRRRARWQTRDLSDQLAETNDPYRTSHERDRLGQALGHLSPDHKVVVAMRFYLDLTVDEIARRLGVRPGTVKSRLHHAMRRLQSELDLTDAQEVHR